MDKFFANFGKLEGEEDVIFYGTSETLDKLARLHGLKSYDVVEMEPTGSDGEIKFRLVELVLVD